MAKEITLHLNEEAVQKIENLSKLHGKSVSEVIEELIKTISSSAEEQALPIEKIKRVVARYGDSLNVPGDVDYKEKIRQWRFEDYNRDLVQRKD